MTTQGYLVDTNIAIAILANEEAAINFVKQAHQAKRPLFFSVITECEVLSGLKSDLELHKIKLFTSQRCLDVTSKIAQQAGHLRRHQRKKSRKLKTPDALIIATALEHQLTLVSRDNDMNFVESELNLPLLKL
ncbi:PIN domain-containing protein [Salinithrix halophila]|uniref:PIN domain-containing protein n=1 Tax=Salinithrix halophila TaxID=1485204 RepID=A0ABV8JCY1_9BACL